MQSAELKSEAHPTLPKGEVMATRNTSVLTDNLSAVKEFMGVGSIATSCVIESIKDIYGEELELIGKQVNRYLRLVTLFKKIYGDGEVAIVKAPARINIIGEHIDYIKYFRTCVLPFGSREYDMLMAMRLRDDDRVRVATTAEGFEPEEFCFSDFPKFDAEKPPDERWLDYLNELGVPPASWDNYIKASAFYLKNTYPDADLKGMDTLFDSTIPIAGGASSSSALVVVSGAGVRMANNMEIDKDELGDSSSKAEWYVGTRGGKMDQFTICLAEEAKALLITFEPFSVQPIDMPITGYKWITFYTLPADKGSRVMSEYNERSIVSRFIIPALLDEILAEEGSHARSVGATPCGCRRDARAGDQARVPLPVRTLREGWEKLLNAIAERNVEEIENNAKTANHIISLLPDAMTLKEVGERFPEMYVQAKGLYPALFEVKGEESELKIRDRTQHHFGEVVRTLAAAKLLRAAAEERENPPFPPFPKGGKGGIFAQNMREVGRLMYETHESLRKLYGISTGDLDKVVSIAKSVKGVCGARLMGGGFGGNVITLVEEESVDELIEAVQREYYAPANRDGLAENSILVSTPGDGLTVVDLLEKSRQKLISLTNDWRNCQKNEREIMGLAKSLLPSNRPIRLNDYRLTATRAVIVAAGKGKRARASGLTVTKPLVEINGSPAITYVLDNVLSVPCAEKPVVIVSSDNEADIKTALRRNYDVEYVIQKEARGTAHAVLQAENSLKDFDGDVIVIWGAQPVIRKQSVMTTVMVHQAVGDSSMTFPTTKRENPYAPIVRNDENWIVDSLETHSEGAQKVNYGEDNIGVFCLRKRDLYDALSEAHAQYFNPATGDYNTPSRELGFPNLMVRTLVTQGKMVLGVAVADQREAYGIKTADDVERLESFISSLDGSSKA